MASACYSTDNAVPADTAQHSRCVYWIGWPNVPFWVVRTRHGIHELREIGAVGRPPREIYRWADDCRPMED